MILVGLLCSICSSLVQLCSFEKITVVLGQPTQHKGGNAIKTGVCTDPIVHNSRH